VQQSGHCSFVLAIILLLFVANIVNRPFHPNILHYKFVHMSSKIKVSIREGNITTEQILPAENLGNLKRIFHKNLIKVQHLDDSGEPIRPPVKTQSAPQASSKKEKVAPENDFTREQLVTEAKKLNITVARIRQMSDEDLKDAIKKGPVKKGNKK
jgi:hypothetical protein